jgi:hypothetical protein
MLYNGLDIHLSKLKLCFQKCEEVGVSMNPNKCAFIVFSRMIMGCIIYRERTLFDLRIHAIVNMPISINPQ